MTFHSSMHINGLACKINLPDAPQGDGVHRLPPYKAVHTWHVDEYPACPTNWMHGSDKASSHFFPVGEGKHMWLDFNENWINKHHVAIVLSIQGINPITGQQSKILRLEQYREKCPVHTKQAFGEDRFCEKCGFKWPSQNYMTTASTPGGQLWVDGWRTEEETIRGFLVTAETMKGIAAQKISDDRVWAIGIAFYLSKEPKPIPKPVTRSINAHQWGSQTLSADDDPIYNSIDESQMKSFGFNNASIAKGGVVSDCAFGDSAEYSCDNIEVINKVSMDSEEKSSAIPVSTRGMKPRSRKIRASAGAQSVRPIEVEKLEIAAGAKINQKLAHHDPNSLDFYQDEPAGIIYGNYCSFGDFEKIIEAGVRDMTQNGEGALAGLDVGNHVKS